TRAQEHVKRVLFEQHTGNWCGWCVDGTYKLDQILEKHPGVVIPVKFHSGDAMAIPLQGEVGKGLGLPGFPAGCIDRTMFGGTYFPNRIASSSDYSINAWMPLVEQRLALAPKMDIKLVYSLDPETLEFKGTVTATMLETLNEDLSFNIYIVEDSLSGTGAQWDQHNYLTNRQGWKFSPFYNLPSTIVGFIHEFTVRDMLGGAWGVLGSFTNLATKDTTYKAYFTTTLKPDWDLKHVSFVATVTGFTKQNRQVYNVINGEVGTPEEPLMKLTTTDGNIDVVNLGTAFKNTYNLKNITDTETTFEIILSKSARTPADWTADISVPKGVNFKKNNKTQTFEITVPAGETKTFDLSLTSATTVGIGDAFVVVSSKTNPDAIKLSAKITVISKEIDHFYVMDNGEKQYSIAPNLPQGKNYFTFSPDEFSLYANKFLAGMKTLVWDIGATKSLSADNIKVIEDALGYGVNVFVCGNMVTKSLQNSLANYGLQFNNLSREGYNAPHSVWLSGIAGDPISGNFGSSVEGNLIHYLLDMFKVTNSDKAFPILRFRDDQIGYDANNQKHSVPKEDALLGARVVTDYDSRLVLLNMTPFVIVDQSKRDGLLHNIFAWLNGEVDVEENTSADGNLSISVAPNPFSNGSEIHYKINGNSPQNVRVSLFNQLGQELKVLKNEVMNPGNYMIEYNNNLTSGAYYLTLKYGTQTVTVPVNIVK
ncbi:MAG: Omp28-related outer membrane protein, partial [Nitrospiraceae bacterium]|nr:Omp28-related outer membrane protein [Nitrospiraceae bacterium]